MAPSLIINPYKVGPPVIGSDFYGREKLLIQVLEALQTSNVVLLQGQRRIGKTSFLKQLSIFLKDKEKMLQGVPLKPVVFDIQRYVQDTLPQFQAHLAESIAKELQVLVPQVTEFEIDHTLFRDIWLPRIYEKLDDHDLIILVDEFDNLSGQGSAQAMQTLIPFLGQLVTGENRLKWIFTLGRQSSRLPIQYDPVVSTGVEFRMSFLSKEEAGQLIQKPSIEKLTFQPAALERIYELTSGQPHLTQAICWEIFQYIVIENERNIVTEEDVCEVIPQTLEEFGGAIASITRVPPVEERIMVVVAQLTENSRTASRDDIINLLLENNIQLGRKELIDVLRSLIEWELLIGNIGRVRFSVELLRLWIIQTLSAEPSPKETLDIKHALSQSRFEFAEKARRAGQYQLAIQDYQEALEHVPNHVEALRGLAESYRLIGEFEKRVKTLETLYDLSNRHNVNDLISALQEYAQKLEREEDFVAAVEKYEKLIKLRDSEIFRVKLVQNLKKYSRKHLQEMFGVLSSNKYLEKKQKPNISRLTSECIFRLRKSTSESEGLLEELKKKSSILAGKKESREFNEFINKLSTACYLNLIKPFENSLLKNFNNMYLEIKRKLAEVSTDCEGELKLETDILAKFKNLIDQIKQVKDEIEYVLAFMSNKEQSKETINELNQILENVKCEERHVLERVQLLKIDLRKKQWNQIKTWLANLFLSKNESSH